MQTRREAAEKAGEFTESALMGAMPMHVPDFKTVIMPAVVAALDEWKQEALKSECVFVFLAKWSQKGQWCSMPLCVREWKEAQKSAAHH